MCFFTIIPFLCHIRTSVFSLARYSLTTLPQSHFWRKGRNNSLVFTLPKFECSFEVLEKDRDKAPLVTRSRSTCDPTPPCDRCLPPHACACPCPAPTPQSWPPLTSSAMAAPVSSSSWPLPLLEAHALPRASSPRQRPRNPRQRKEAVRRRRRWRFLCRGPTLGKEMVFLKFFLPRAGPRQRIFFKSLPRASSLALGKEIFRIFKKKSLPRAIARALAKDPSLPRALVIALGKET